MNIGEVAAACAPDRSRLGRALFGFALLAWLIAYLPIGAAIQPAPDVGSKLAAVADVVGEAWYLLLQWSVWAALFTTLLLWMRVRTSLLWRNEGPQSISSAEAVYCWFIPIVWFVRPYQALAALTKLLPRDRRSTALERIRVWWIWNLATVAAEFLLPTFAVNLPADMINSIGGPDPAATLGLMAFEAYSGWLFLLALESLLQAKWLTDGFRIPSRRRLGEADERAWLSKNKAQQRMGLGFAIGAGLLSGGISILGASIPPVLVRLVGAVGLALMLGGVGLYCIAYFARARPPSDKDGN